MASIVRALITIALACSLAACTQRSGTGSAEATPSPVSQTQAPASVPSAPASMVAAMPQHSPVSFTDISGVEGESAIRALGQLGVLDSTSGTFGPHDPIKRRDYIRWLVKANNVYFKEGPSRIRLAETSAATFVDVPSNDPDYKYIQGMADTGYLVGYDKTHFKPDKLLSREEMLAILISRDTRGKYSLNSGPPDFSDGMQVSKVYRAYLNADSNAWNGSAGQINRIYGAAKALHPLANATRADAALAISVIEGASAETLAKH